VEIIKSQLVRFAALFLLVSSCGFIHEKVDTQAEDGTRIAYTKELGVKEGLYQHFHKNGQVRFEVQFVGGNEEGEGKFYDNTGRLEMVELYKEGTVISSTEYHENGAIKLTTERKDKLRHGALFQMTDKSDTIVVAYFELDTTKYIKAYDVSKEDVLDYYLDYRLGFAARGQDSVLIKLMHRSPDPKVEWKFALGVFSDEAIDNYEYEASPAGPSVYVKLVQACSLDSRETKPQSGNWLGFFIYCNV